MKRWYGKKRKRGVVFATGDQCSNCHYTLRDAYPKLTFAELVDRIDSSTSFAKEFSLADQIRQGMKERRGFKLQSVDSSKHAGYKISMVYAILTIDEFQKRFGCTPKQLSVPVDKFYDEEGNKLQGIVLRESNSLHGYRRLEVFFEVFDSRFVESAHNPGSQLRRDQGKECHESLLADTLKQRASRMRRGSHTMSFEEVDALRATQSSSAAAVTQTTAKDDDEDSASNDGEGEEESGDDSASEQLCSSGSGSDKEDEAPPTKVGKGKGRGRGRARGGLLGLAGRALVAASASKTPSAAITNIGTSAKGGSSGAGAGTPEKLQENVQSYLNLISLGDILEGQNRNNEMYQAKRTIVAMERRPDNFERDLPVLRDHLQLAELAKKVAAEHLGKLSADVREAHLKDFVKEKVVFGPIMKAALVVQVAKETNLRGGGGGGSTRRSSSYLSSSHGHRSPTTAGAMWLLPSTP